MVKKKPHNNVETVVITSENRSCSHSANEETDEGYESTCEIDSQNLQ